MCFSYAPKGDSSLAKTVTEKIAEILVILNHLLFVIHLPKIDAFRVTRHFVK